VGSDVEEMSLVREGNEWLIDLEERYRPAVEMLRLIGRQDADSAAADTTPPDTRAADTTSAAP
jgi:hypothetical protein